MTPCTYNNLEPHDVTPDACAWHVERRDPKCEDCPNYHSVIPAPHSVIPAKAGIQEAFNELNEPK
jgi:hypothetical protein